MDLTGNVFLIKSNPFSNFVKIEITESEIQVSYHKVVPSHHKIIQCNLSVKISYEVIETCQIGTNLTGNGSKISLSYHFCFFTYQ